MKTKKSLMNRAVYITEAGKKIGFGHLKRAVSLQQLFPNYEFDIFLERTLSMDWKHEYKTWEVSLSLVVLISQYDVVIFDSFHGNEQVYNDLERHPCVIYIDDYVRYPVKNGLVVDWTVGAERRKATGKSCCFGVDYLITRQPFFKPKETNCSNQITKISTIFGGSDPCDISSKIASLIGNERNLKVKHLGTKFYPSYPKFKDDKHFYWDLIDDDFAEHILDSDIVITAGGQTLYEIASLGVPVIAISVAANQDEDIEGFHRLGSCKVLGIESISSILSLLKSITIEDRMGMIQASKCVDGRGDSLKLAIDEFINECNGI
jgi:UDP-2,4-diacetamido-2,4,6-trideoxy-beta-L-altropyranose hydrolase